MSGDPSFRPATPWGWVIWSVRNYLRLELAWWNRLRLERRDLRLLWDLPQNAGLILVANHADETDFKACLELSGRCNRRFLFMMNREAFDEGHGIAGWWLQRLGAFSVERGGQNEQAKRYAIEIVKRGRAVLVVFPEGEIYYLNDLVQPFKSGVVDIGMQAVTERGGFSRTGPRTSSPWPSSTVTANRFARSWSSVRDGWSSASFKACQEARSRDDWLSSWRNSCIVRSSIHRLKPDPDRLAELSERVQDVRQAVLEMEGHYPSPTVRSKAQTMDRTWRPSSSFRKLLRQGRELSDQGRDRLLDDLAVLKRCRADGKLAAELRRPGPVSGAAGGDGPQAGARGLRDQPATPAGQTGRLSSSRRAHRPGRFVACYLHDPESVRRQVAEQLRDVIQNLIDAILNPPA